MQDGFGAIVLQEHGEQQVLGLDVSMIFSQGQ
jgi:hypothetical protein